MSVYQTERVLSCIPKPDRKASDSAVRMPWHCAAKLRVLAALPSVVTRSKAAAEQPARYEYVQKAETQRRHLAAGHHVQRKGE